MARGEVEEGKLYKVTDPDGKPRNGGAGIWPLPKRGRPGAWWKVKGTVELCSVGLHLTDEEHILTWLGYAPFTIWEAEGRGGVESDGSKFCFQEARLLRPVVTITAEMARRPGPFVGDSSSVTFTSLQHVIEYAQNWSPAPSRITFGTHRMRDPWCPAWPKEWGKKQWADTVRKSGQLLGISSKQDRALKSVAQVQGQDDLFTYLIAGQMGATYKGQRDPSERWNRPGRMYW